VTFFGPQKRSNGMREPLHPLVRKACFIKVVQSQLLGQKRPKKPYISPGSNAGFHRNGKKALFEAVFQEKRLLTPEFRQLSNNV
jgi:hypothetical protein